MPKPRKYAEEGKQLYVPSQSEPTGVNLLQPKQRHNDPLRRREVASPQYQNSNMVTSQKRKGTILNWNAKKADYLKKYTTDKNIPVMSSIVEGPDDATASVVKLEDRARMRLEQLQKDEKDQEYTTQKKIIEELESLNLQCANSWNNHDRVKALKIVIKCTKSLAVNQVPQFYPSLYVLVAEVLDTFGGLVYERIFSRSEVVDPVSGKVESKLSKVFSVKDVTEDAKETCRNWFYKVASIRELIPRIYVEMSLLSCQKFLTDDKKKIKEEFVRLAKAIRGIGEPMVAMYARLYLAKKGSEIIPEEKDYLLILFKDFLRIVDSFKTDSFVEKLKSLGLSLDQYIDLYSPCIEWLLECIGVGEGEDMFNLILDKYQNEFKKSVFLLHLIRAFDAKVVSNAASVLVFLVKEYQDPIVPKHVCFRALGEKFAVVPPNEKVRLLNEIWGYITDVDNIEDYLQIVEVYVEFVTKYFTMKQVTVLFADLMRHIKNEQNFKLEGKIEQYLKNILLLLLENAPDFVQVFNMEYFLQIFDMLKSNTRVQVSKGILNAFNNPDVDPVVLNSLFDLAKTVHDSLNYLSDPQEVNSVTESLYSFILKIQFGNSFEKHLKFLTDCRSVFTNFDKPKEAMIMKVLEISYKTLTLMNGKHSKQTLVFVKSCFSFVHITIPSIDNIFSRLHLFCLSGQFSLMNGLLGQADSLFKAAIENVLNAPSSQVENGLVVDTETELVEFINTLTSCLISVPGHPEFGPFYLFRGLLNAIQNYKWPRGSDGKIKCLMNVLNALACFYQRELPYSYIGVSGNDELYMEDDKYEEEIFSMADTVIEDILNGILELGNETDTSIVRKQKPLLTEFKNCIQCHTIPSKVLLEKIDAIKVK